MNNLTIFAVLKVRESSEQHLFFAESIETADKLYFKALENYFEPDISIQLVSFNVNKDRLYDFIVGEDDYEKEQFLLNALGKHYSLIKSSTG